MTTHMTKSTVLEVDSTGKLTKRGKAAAKYLGEIRMLAVEALKVGDTIREYIGFSGETSYFLVEWVEPEGNFFKIIYNNRKYGRREQKLPIGTRVRIGWSPEIKQAQLEMACTYQDTLNTWGKPRKGVRNGPQIHA